ncbi:MAG: flagellar biosynthesis protein FlhB [Bosea sp. (in: a-proteobacteria)]
MADEKDQEDRTEEPTQRKLEEAIKKGDVARSVEIGTFFVLCGFTLAMIVAGGPALRNASLSLRSFLMNAHQVSADGAGFTHVTTKGIIAGFSAMAGPLGFILVAALLGALIQHKPLWTTEPMTPKFSRISLMGGFKRLFGKEGWINFIKGLAKIAMVGAVVSVVLWGERDRLDAFARMDVAMLLPAMSGLVAKLMIGVLSIYGVIAIGDFAWQKFSWHRRQRMTMQEIKDEHKESDGNPEIKAKIREIRNKRARQRMMSNVPTATVIVTNPTHYAVALKYESGMPAPLCVAKGIDAVALKIREVAGEHDVPIVENVPLARALHASVQIDDEIPTEHYQAVAEVIGYVMRLKRMRR